MRNTSPASSPSTSSTPSSGGPRRKFGLRRGLSLLPSEGGTYHIGRGNQSIPITSPFARTAAIAIAQGRDPFQDVPASHHWIIEKLIASLAGAHLLTDGRREIALPPRYLNELVGRDLAAQQLRMRCEPELLQCEWSIPAAGSGRDCGAEILAARATAKILISGRNRIATLIYTLLLESGVSLVAPSDRFDTQTINDLDIGTSTITGAELSLNYYEHLHAQRRYLSLFPLERGVKRSLENTKPALIIHSGEIDLEDIVDWLSAGQPHIVIAPAVGDEITISPLVIPGASPCLRCADLNQRDRLGYSSSERIGLTEVDEVPMVGAYFIAALVTAQVLEYIDSQALVATTGFKKSSPAVLVAQSITINLQELTQPQVVAITRHPLCGCETLTHNRNC